MSCLWSTVTSPRIGTIGTFGGLPCHHVGQKLPVPADSVSVNTRCRVDSFSEGIDTSGE